MRKRNGVILLVIGIIVFFSTLEGWGADWRLISKDPFATWEVDITSVSLQSNNFVRAWFKLTYTKEGIARFVNELGPTFNDLAYSNSLYEYDCTEKKARILSTTAYSLDGKVIKASHSPLQWTFVTPESVDENNLNTLCK